LEDFENTNAAKNGDKSTNNNAFNLLSVGPIQKTQTIITTIVTNPMKSDEAFFLVKDIACL